MEIKKFISIIIIIANIGLLQAQYTAIPDACFELKLIEAGIDSEGIQDGQVLTSDIENVISLSINYSGSSDCAVFDPTGIEAFINLEYLYFDDGFTTLDLSNNIHLKEIISFGSSLQSINLTNCTELTYLGITHSYLTNINLSTNINLEYLHLSFNQLSNINTLNNLNLLKLYVDNNQLSEININHLTNLNELGVNNNELTELNISNLNNLNKVYAYYNLINNINLSNLQNLEALGLANNNLSNVNFSNLNLLKIINLENNQLGFVDLRNGNNTNITYFNTENNQNLTCIYVDDSQYSQANWLNIDNNSTFVETDTECDALATSENIFSNELVVFPNPVRNTLHFKNENINIKEITIFNILGKEVYNGDTTTVDFSNLVNGLYIIKIKTNENNTITKKIIKIGA